MKSAQQGFTLIELMIVVSIISIMTSIVLPTYQDYTIRTRMAEVILAASSCRTMITEMYLVGSDSPGADNWGCEDASSILITAINTNANGGIQITISSALGSDLAGDTVLMIPINNTGAAMEWDDTGSIQRWDCGPGTIRSKYLPSSCRVPGLTF
jgi:type IV pilus assembly protein PilA